MKNGEIEMKSFKRIVEKDNEKEDIALKHINQANGMYLDHSSYQRYSDEDIWEQKTIS